jgi:hypothetical protein
LLVEVRVEPAPGVAVVVLVSSCTEQITQFLEAPM